MRIEIPLLTGMSSRLAKNMALAGALTVGALGMTTVGCHRPPEIDHQVQYLDQFKSNTLNTQPDVAFAFSMQQLDKEIPAFFRREGMSYQHVNLKSTLLDTVDATRMTKNQKIAFVAKLAATQNCSSSDFATLQNKASQIAGTDTALRDKAMTFLGLAEAYQSLGHQRSNNHNKSPMTLEAIQTYHQLRQALVTDQVQSSQQSLDQNRPEKVSSIAQRATENRTSAEFANLNDQAYQITANNLVVREKLTRFLALSEIYGHRYSLEPTDITHYHQLRLALTSPN